MIDRPITIIAEIGINHNGSICRAIDMIWAARRCGAEVAKFQIYVPERVLDLDHPGIKKHWGTIKAAELSFDDVSLFKEACDAAGIEFLASVFHPDRVEWTEQIGMERYKIASRSIYDRPLAEAIAATGKPIIMSWGWYEPKKGPPALINYLDYPAGLWDRVKDLYCVSKYPTALCDLEFNKHTFRSFGGRYDGFSDHTTGITASIVAMSLGATIIEKHFTLDKNMSGFDHAWSIEPDELRQLCNVRDGIEETLWS